MNRKEFIKKALFAIGVGLPILTLIQGCGSDDSATPSSQASCLDNGTNVSIGSNHGHSLTVSKTDVEQAAEKVYSIDGSSGHSHQVTLTSSHLQSVQQNQSINVDSNTSSGHSHSINVSCA